MESAAFYIFGLLAVLLALATILHRNIFKSATLLAGFFFCLAALFITLKADFLAVVQVLIYVGAITVLIVFAVMLTGRINDERREIFNTQKWVGLVSVIGLSGVVLAFLLRGDWKDIEVAPGLTPVDPLNEIGASLLSDYILAFDLLTVLLLVALIGALYIARRDKPRASLNLTTEEENK